MAKQLEATESKGLEEALQRLPEMEAWVQRLLGRVRPFMDLPPGALVLDLGAAQGVTVVAFKRAGFESFGVEPFEPAIAVGRQLSERTGVPFETRHGVGEALPYEDASFDFVHAYSVMEHVDDPEQVFREVYRVLRPAGGFFFETTSALSPKQGEIARFPLFPWYPARTQRAIMMWAARERPWLVGGTTRPAIHWFKHRAVKRSLSAVGFQSIVDRWTLHAESGELCGARQLLVRVASRHQTIRLIGDIRISGLGYLAVK